MGYSISVIPRSRTLGDKALDFFKRNYRNLGSIVSRDDWSDPNVYYVSELRWGPLAYDGSRSCIGFDYSPAWMEREYAHALIQWLAIRVGRKTKGVPYFRYDGNKEIIHIRPEHVDQDGWFTKAWFDKQRSIFLRREYRTIGRAVVPELRRLSKLWEEENATGDRP